MGVLVLALAIPAVRKKEKKSEPHQEASRLVRGPTEGQRRVIVPPCGTGVSGAPVKPDALAQTARSGAVPLKKGPGGPPAAGPGRPGGAGGGGGGGGGP